MSNQHNQQLPELPSPSELRDWAESLKKQVDGLRKLADGVDTPQAKRLGPIIKRLSELPNVVPGEVLTQFKGWLDTERATRGVRLRCELEAACQARGVPMTVLGRDPLEIGIAPFVLQIDVEADSVTLQYARETLCRVPANATAIFEAYDQQITQLEGEAWDPNLFVTAAHQAWLRAGGSGWLEITDVLPELAVLRQSSTFRRNPIQRHFVSYGRIQFAYDLWRLRRDRVLSTGKVRLNLGAATGGSTRDKRRVMWVEDGRGRGQFYLTIRFTEEN
jgi:hypothetical protein